ncbi:MAG: rRNA maturation RNase YbeY [archaeon]|jgi:probable rRNA maturation factor
MIEINNLTKFKIDEKSFSQVAKKVLKGENKEIETLSLVFVNKQEIKKLNKKFRGKDKATDVLSFDLSAEDGPALDQKNNYLGEVVICPEIVKENSEKYKTDFEKELIKVFVHGVLHLLGYDHEGEEKKAEEMEEREKKYF